MIFKVQNDVESFSISLNRCDPDTADKVYRVGLPRLLDLLAKHDILSTFYFTGMMAEMVPEALELVKTFNDLKKNPPQVQGMEEEDSKDSVARPPIRGWFYGKMITISPQNLASKETPT